MPDPVTPAAPAAPVTPAAPAAPVTPASPIAWLPSADEATVGYVQNKGWDDPSKLVSSYQNLEKLIGAERAGRTVTMPGDKAEPAEVEAFYNKLGRPAEASGYKLDVPQGQPTEFADTAKKWFHEAGLTAKQAETVGKHWNEFIATKTAAAQQTQMEKAQLDQQALQKEWGAAHAQNLQLAQQTRANLGVSNEEVDGIAQTLGLKRTIELFHKLGQRTGEGDFVAGNGPTNFGSAITPAQAKAKIDALRADKSFAARYLKKDADAVAEMGRLHKLAYPA